MTLLELLVSMSVMLLVVGMLAGLAKGVQLSHEHGESYGTVTQHARVVLERICRTVNKAKGNDKFPGVLVLAEYQGSWRFPDTLVVWRLDATPAADRVPLYKEIAVYCPSPTAPNELLEITVPGDTNPVPPATDLTTWSAAVAAIKTSGTRVVLTKMLRTASVTDDLGARLRGALRFEPDLTPSATQWAQYKAGSRTWDQLGWIQGIRSSVSGLCQARVRIELQLQPQSAISASGAGAIRAIPFFGSAALYCMATEDRNW